MIRMRLLRGTLGPVALLVFIIAPGFNGATPEVFASDYGAVISNEFECQLSAIPGAEGLLTMEGHSTITPSGNTVLSCRFDIPTGFEPK